MWHQIGLTMKGEDQEFKGAIGTGDGKAKAENGEEMEYGEREGEGEEDRSADGEVGI